MRLRFNEAKATQAAARLLNRRNNRMSYLSLIKLLYFIDREALLTWGRPVTTDRYVSMDNGPVVSRIYDLIREEQRPGTESYWHRFISGPEDYEVTLLKQPPPDELSPAEEQLIDEVFDRFKDKTKWELVDISHDLPEWVDPEGSALPITYRDILSSAGMSESEIRVIESEIESLAVAEALTLAQ